MRRLLALMLLAAVTPGTLLRDPPVVVSYVQRLAITPLPAPDAEGRALLGPFAWRGGWHLESPNTLFGGYSALLTVDDAKLLAISDSGNTLLLSEPDAPNRPALHIGAIGLGRSSAKASRDIEAATRDSRSGTIWLGWEGRNAISRHGADLSMQAILAQPGMKDWPANTGAESLVRLADGRFVVLSEAFPSHFDGKDHAGLLFAGDPAEGAQARSFTFEGPRGYRPTDMAQLPDGRVLVLMRRVAWPLPLRFAGLVVALDPATLRAGGTWRGKILAKLEPPLPVDNFEGIAVRPAPAGGSDVWIISDDNTSQFQRTLLLRLFLPASRP